MNKFFNCLDKVLLKKSAINNTNKTNNYTLIEEDLNKTKRSLEKMSPNAKATTQKKLEIKKFSNYEDSVDFSRILNEMSFLKNNNKTEEKNYNDVSMIKDEGHWESILESEKSVYNPVFFEIKKAISVLDKANVFSLVKILFLYQIKNKYFLNSKLYN